MRKTLLRKSDQIYVWHPSSIRCIDSINNNIFLVFICGLVDVFSYIIAKNFYSSRGSTDERVLLNRALFWEEKKWFYWDLIFTQALTHKPSPPSHHHAINTSPHKNVLSNTLVDILSIKSSKISIIRRTHSWMVLKACRTPHNCETNDRNCKNGMNLYNT